MFLLFVPMKNGKIYITWRTVNDKKQSFNAN